MLYIRSAIGGSICWQEVLCPTVLSLGKLRHFTENSFRLIRLRAIHHGKLAFSYRAYCGQSLAKKLAGVSDAEEQIRFTVEFVENTTQLTDFGKYLSTLLELDAFILNEDRHTNNIAVLRNEKTGQYRLCPIFDNGLSFLSDMNDYPLEGDLYENIAKVEAKPFSRDFMVQMEAATNLYGSSLHFELPRRDIDSLFDGLAEHYPEEVIERARKVLLEQMRKFQYLL